MKKLLIIGLFIFILSGCTQTSISTKTQNNSNSVASVIQEQKEKSDNVSTTFTDVVVVEEEKIMEEVKKEAETKSIEYNNIDVDLTKLSSTLVYSEVNNIMTKSDEYMGKVIKMKGLYNTLVENNVRYHACIIQDATACCANGLEFIPVSSDINKLPNVNEEVVVIGVLTSYTLDNAIYLTLEDAVICE